jgi:hypothetical protein
MKDQLFTAEQLEAYRQHLIADYFRFSPNGSFDIVFEPGQKYMRVVAVTGQGVSRSSHSFLDAAGNIWKSASWKAPAKNFIRGSIVTGEFTRCRWNGVS